MNIWFISKYASPPKYAKMPSRLYCLTKEAQALGNNVRLITSDSNHFSQFPVSKKIYNDENILGVPVRWIKTKKYKRTASISRVLSWLDFEFKLFLMNLRKMEKPEAVVVSSLSIFTILYGYYLKRKYKAFLVFEIRDIWPLTMTEEGGFSKRHILVRFIGWLEKFGYEKADLVVGTMPKLDLHVKTILGYDKPFFCSPLGFDFDTYKDSKSVLNNPFEKYRSDNHVVIGYAGSMGITNALDTFVETIKLMKDNSNIRFLLVGSGDLKEMYIEQLREQSNVIFLPRISQNEVKQFLEICDITYLSTKSSKVWDYGQSMNKIVEYMLASKPIIANYTGFPSMINEANCGLYLDRYSPSDLRDVFLEYASLSKDELQQIGVRGRDWIYKNRTYTLLAKQYVDQIITGAFKMKKNN